MVVHEAIYRTIAELSKHQSGEDTVSNTNFEMPKNSFLSSALFIYRKEGMAQAI